MLLLLLVWHWAVQACVLHMLALPLWLLLGGSTSSSRIHLCSIMLLHFAGKHAVLMLLLMLHWSCMRAHGAMQAAALLRQLHKQALLQRVLPCS
jgi:hypothetical protein